MSNKKQRDSNRANHRELIKALEEFKNETPNAESVAEEDRRFGQPHYGHDDNERQ
jgi:hypothetical protein